MKIALIADIHSNIYALEAVLEDIEKRDVDTIVCLGDLVGYCTFPNEVINKLKENNIMTIMGNYDDAVGNERSICGCDYPDPKDAENANFSLMWSILNTSEDNKKFLRELPTEMRLSFNGKTIVFLHGSPREMNEYLKENSKQAQEVMDEYSGDILVCAHTHIPYSKYYGKKVLINAGSAGKPKTGVPDANYMILEISEDETKTEVIEVSYNYEATAKAIEAEGLPQKFATVIRTGNA